MISSNKKEIKHSARHHDKRKDMHAYMNKKELVFVNPTSLILI
jgi:hypothetical protein